jgi:hypothetical protein
MVHFLVEPFPSEVYSNVAIWPFLKQSARNKKDLPILTFFGLFKISKKKLLAYFGKISIQQNIL